MNKVIKIGLIGYGTVGSGVAKLMFKEGKPFLRGRGFSIELVKIADLDTTTDRGIKVPNGILTTNTDSILDDNI